jgi:hypothetical protein
LGQNSIGSAKFIRFGQCQGKAEIELHIRTTMRSLKIIGERFVNLDELPQRSQTVYSHFNIAGTNRNHARGMS